MLVAIVLAALISAFGIFAGQQVAAFVASDSPGLGSSPASGVVDDNDDLSVFDENAPAVINLNGELLAAVRLAAHDAAVDDVIFYVTSGWRSPEYQQDLLDEAIIEYGSEEEAARWVASAETSEHVSGDAIDIGSYDAIEWLAEHGDGYGLCQIYDNEPWHFELRTEAVDTGCPRKLFDPTDDPRMQE